jgi:hypothetical protein
MLVVMVLSCLSSSSTADVSAELLLNLKEHVVPLQESSTPSQYVAWYMVRKCPATAA